MPCPSDRQHEAEEPDDQDHHERSGKPAEAVELNRERLRNQEHRTPPAPLARHEGTGANTLGDPPGLPRTNEDAHS